MKGGSLALHLGDTKQRRLGFRANKGGCEVGGVEDTVGVVLDVDEGWRNHWSTTGGGLAVDVENHSEHKVPIHVLGAPLACGADGDEGYGGVDTDLGRPAELVLPEVGWRATGAASDWSRGCRGGGREHPPPLSTNHWGTLHKEGGGGDINVAVHTATLSNTSSGDSHHDRGEEEDYKESCHHRRSVSTWAARFRKEKEAAAQHTSLDSIPKQ